MLKFKDLLPIQIGILSTFSIVMISFFISIVLMFAKDFISILDKILSYDSFYVSFFAVIFVFFLSSYSFFALYEREKHLMNRFFQVIFFSLYFVIPHGTDIILRWNALESITFFCLSVLSLLISVVFFLKTFGNFEVKKFSKEPKS